MLDPATILYSSSHIPWTEKNIRLLVVFYPIFYEDKITLYASNRLSLLITQFSWIFLGEAFYLLIKPVYFNNRRIILKNVDFSCSRSTEVVVIKVAVDVPLRSANSFREVSIHYDSIAAILALSSLTVHSS